MISSLGFAFCQIISNYFIFITIIIIILILLLSLSLHVLLLLLLIPRHRVWRGL